MLNLALSPLLSSAEPICSTAILCFLAGLGASLCGVAAPSSTF